MLFLVAGKRTFNNNNVAVFFYLKSFLFFMCSVPTAYRKMTLDFSVLAKSWNFRILSKSCANDE